MKNQLIIFLLVGTIALISCAGQKENNCGDRMCTMEFRTIQVKFVDKDGKLVSVKDFKSVNTRTNKTLSTGDGTEFTNTEGAYVVATDANLKDLSVEGDSVLVTAKNANNQTAEGKFKIAGGVCACHISKISGPEEISFD